MSPGCSVRIRPLPPSSSRWRVRAASAFRTTSERGADKPSMTSAGFCLSRAAGCALRNCRPIYDTLGSARGIPPEASMIPDIERRKCLAMLGGALVWPVVARAQQAQRVRRIGVLIYGGEDTPGSQAQVAALRDGLKELGWVEDRNLRMVIRFDSDPNRLRAHAEALVSQAPDLIVVSSLAATRALQQQTQTIPIVFAGVGDPVVNGLVASLARPEGNITGVTNLFVSIGGKWVELLKELAPRLARVAVIFNPDLTTTPGW